MVYRLQFSDTAQFVTKFPVLVKDLDIVGVMRQESEEGKYTHHYLKYRDANTRSRVCDTAMTTAYNSGVQLQNKILEYV